MTNSEAATVFGLVLAGGRGRRLGGVDKAALEIGGVSLLARAAAALAPASAIAVAVGPGRDDLPDGVVAVFDPVPGVGPLAGLAAGLAWAEAAGADWLITTPVDAPFLEAKILWALLAAATAEDEALIAADDERVHWLIGAWRTGLAVAARTACDGEDVAVAAFLKSRRWRPVVFPGDADHFLNINLPNDLAAAQRRADERGQ